MESPSQENNTLHATPPESRAELEEAAAKETADGKRGIQWREIIRQAFDKARQTQQPRPPAAANSARTKASRSWCWVVRRSPCSCYSWAYSLRLKRRREQRDRQARRTWAAG